ncbi:MAG TPA: hypothetical protein VEW48_19880 [Thermoanaerobaculia bacterium]|nr:hypothetical protein [Thermoanaerobaculia bacterium]
MGTAPPTARPEVSAISGPPGTDDRLALLEQRIEDLASSLQSLEHQVARLAGREISPAPAPTPFQETAATEPAGAPPAEVESALPGGFSLVGRTLVVLGGAYLLRALTAAGLLPEVAGILLAFLYALSWLAWAERDGRRGRTASAGFHGVTGALIGLPLVWEATTRFHYLTPAASGAAVAVLAAAALAVAWRHRLAALGWAAGLGAMGLAFALVVGTRVWPPFAIDFILLGLAGLLLAYGRGWRGLGWVLAAAAHAGILLALLVAQVKPEGAGITRPAAIALGLALCLSVLASFTVRLLRLDGQVGLFEAFYSTLAFLIGYAVMASLAWRTGGAAALGVGLLGLALSLGSYAAAFGVIDRQERRKLLLYSGLGFAFLLAASLLLLPRDILALAWAVLAMGAAAVAVRIRRITLSLHGTLIALAAAIASGLVAAAAYALAAPPGVSWPVFSGPAVLALAAAAFACALPVPRPAPFWKPFSSATRLLQLAVFAWGAGGALLYLLAPALAGGAGAATDPGLLATARTLVLVGTALLLAWVGRWERFHEAGWLVYPVLVLGILKLLVEDFPHGRPVTLSLALALCGGAFILAPRLLRRSSQFLGG